MKVGHPKATTLFFSIGNLWREVNKRVVYVTKYDLWLICPLPSKECATVTIFVSSDISGTTSRHLWRKAIYVLMLGSNPYRSNSTLLRKMDTGNYPR